MPPHFVRLASWRSHELLLSTTTIPASKWQAESHIRRKFRSFSSASSPPPAVVVLLPLKESPWTITHRPFENNVHKVTYAALPLLALLRLADPGLFGVTLGVAFLFGSLMSNVRGDKRRDARKCSVLAGAASTMVT